MEEHLIMNSCAPHNITGLLPVVIRTEMTYGSISENKLSDIMRCVGTLV